MTATLWNGDVMDQRERIAALFDRVADTYDRVGVDLFQPIAARLVEEVAPMVGERVVDIGCGPDSIRAAGPILRAATSSLLVVRPCYLGLRRALECGVRPTGVVLIDEPGRALRASDVEAVLGVRVCAHLDLDPAVARAADGGLLAHRLPRSLERGLRHAA